ncbi:hypothetical protein LTR09_012041 [Extremus antarcticus]|uniref:Uncharacterized protein n=1 Tax=Extremus antarcticus TaxID=702011 RepID=A0AAJ0DB33_9PEZI|nr:hypothetical protein LTR09_012041 [Extremus antarcticus]
MSVQCAHYHNDSKFYSPKLAKVGEKGPLTPLNVAINDIVPQLETFRTSLTETWQNGLVKCMSTIYQGQCSTSVVFIDGKPNITIIAEPEVKKLVL